MGEYCPMALADTDVRVEDLDRGVALTFTTSDPTQVAALRDHVRAMAERHRMNQGRVTSHPGWGAGMMMLNASETNVFDVDRGARLELRAAEPDQVAALRDRGRLSAERMREGWCPMMMMRATG